MCKSELKAVRTSWEGARDFVDDVHTELNGYDGYIYLCEVLEAVPAMLEHIDRLKLELHEMDSSVREMIAEHNRTLRAEMQRVKDLEEALKKAAEKTSEEA